MRSSAVTRRQGYRTATWVALCGILASALLPVITIFITRVLAGGPYLPRESEPPQPIPLSEVMPIPCHSHNDFWRKVPLESALEAGCIGVEADVWPYEGDLFIGHSRGSLDTSRTLTSLYIEPLAKLLRHKPAMVPESFHGIYDANPSQTVVLLIDVKADLAEAWPLLLRALQPLHQQGWLSHLETGKMIMGPITVVVTGDSVGIHLVNATTSAESGVFLDAPLHKLSARHSISNGHYWASASFPKSVGWLWTGRLRPSQVQTIREHVRMAHSQGLKARYWGLPAWPAATQKHTLEVLLQEGVDLINVDNIEAIVPYVRYRAIEQTSSRPE